MKTYRKLTALNKKELKNITGQGEGGDLSYSCNKQKDTIYCKDGNDVKLCNTKEATCTGGAFSSKCDDSQVSIICEGKFHIDGIF